MNLSFFHKVCVIWIYWSLKFIKGDLSTPPLKLSRRAQLGAASSRVFINLASAWRHGTARQQFNYLSRAARADRQTWRTLTLARQFSQLTLDDSIPQVNEN